MHDTQKENDRREEASVAPSRRTRLWRAALVIGGILAICLTAAGCGGGSSTPGVATAPPAAAATTTTSPVPGGSTQATGLVAYASCIRSHGVPGFPDPDSSGGIPKQAVVSAFEAVGNAKAQAAESACRALFPSGGSLSGQPVQTITAQDRQDYLRAAACMRAHGIPDFPDPKFTSTSAQLNLPPSVNQNSSQFTNAATICTKLIPAGLPGSHRGSS
jgi:hypothetical protein